MADTIESEFIASFHTLSGTTIKERTKNFYSLLNKTQHVLQTSSGKISLTSLVPKTPLEESFKVTALIHFKCAHELLDVLKSENPLLIDRVMKHSSWIIKQAYIDITPEYLATQLFPNISYNAKLKLLNQLAYHMNDTHTADNYFEAIHEHYSYYLACKLLPCCSSTLIMKCVEQHKTEITPKQLLLILKRYPDLTEIMFEKLDNPNAKLSIGEKYRSVFKQLCKTNLKLFIKLYEKYSPRVCLGPKETASLIKSARKSNITNLIKIVTILKTKQIGKSMETEFKDFYLENFPKSVNKLRDNLKYNCDLLKHLPSTEKLKMFSSTFKKIYGNEVWEYPELMEEFFIEWVSPDDRAVLIEHVSRPLNINEVTWISYYKNDKSIPLLKEKIALTSNAMLRGSCIAALLTTCKLNRDESGLLDVLKYVNLKHRNDRSEVIRQFISTFNSLYVETQLSQEHWSEIFQCVQLFTLNNNSGYDYSSPIVLEKCIRYRLNHNLLIDDILEFWAKHYAGEYNICKSNHKYEKHCLAMFESLVPLGYKKDDLSKGYVRYLYCVNAYNTSNPHNKLVVNIKKEYLEYVKEILENNKSDYEAQGAANVIILQDCNQSHAEGLLDLLFNQEFYYCHQYTVMEWLIRENPLLMLHYLRYMVKATSLQSLLPRIVTKFCRKYTHLKISEQLSKLCYKAVNDDDNNDRYTIKVPIVILSMITTPQEFLNFASSYYPTDQSPDLGNETNQIQYIKQQTIASHFKNLIPASQILDGVVQFCKGDYLKFAQKSIDEASNNVVENKIFSFLDTLKDRAVSVRKYSIFLSCRLLNRTKADQILLHFNQKEKNPSLRKVLFKTAFCTFLINPQDSTWDLTKQFLREVDLSDDEAFGILTACRQVPLLYFGEYFEYSWTVLKNCTGSNKKIDDGRLKLLNLVTPANISTIPTEFCVKVIEENLFICKRLTDLQIGVHNFTCKYIIYGLGEEEERLQAVFTLFKDYKDKHWNILNERTLILQMINNLIIRFCDDIIDKKCTNKVIFKKFLSKWKDILEPSEMFAEFVYLQLTEMYISAVDKKLTICEIGEKVASLCNLLNSENCFVSSYFSQHLQTFLDHFYAVEHIDDSDENQLTFIESIVNNRNSYVCLELAMDLLPNSIPVAPRVRQKYDYIVDTIYKEPNCKVQVVFNTYLRNIILHNVEVI